MALLKNVLFLFHILLIQPRVIEQFIESDWKFKESDSNEYLKASVPGSVHLDLLKNKAIKDPFYRENSKLLNWIENKEWEYKTTFTVTQEMLDKDVVEIVFNRLDTHTVIKLNNEIILKTNNVFRTWSANVKNLVKLENNELNVRFLSTVDYDREQMRQLMPLEVPTDSSNRKPFSRKPRYHYGWDWGPRMMIVGIGNPIKLLGWEKAIIRDVLVKLDQLIFSEATIQLTVVIELYQADTNSLSIDVQVKSSGATVSSIQQGLTSCEPGENDNVTSTILNITISEPKLWWVHSLGDPHLYEILVVLKLAQDVIDSRSVSYGIRTLEIVQKPDNITEGTSFNVKLNGVDVFMMGSNYIPMDVFVTRVTRDQQEQLIDSAVKANHNMIRIWGGGYYENDDFYNICDRRGVLIFQDFMFGNEMYPGTKEFLLNVEQEVIEQVKRLQHHPSIALWNGNNEVKNAWEDWGLSAGMNVTHKKQLWDWYKQIFEALIPDIIRQYDPNRFYWPTSPQFGFGHREAHFSGDIHDWSVWAERADIFQYDRAIGRFFSEYGMQGIPEMSTILKFTADSDLSIQSEVMKVHQKHHSGFENIQKYIDNNFPSPVKFDDYQYVSQLMQSFAIGTAINAHRRTKPFCMGTLYWQLNDVWPGVTWSSIDYYGNWKSNFSHTFIQDQADVDIHIISEKLGSEEVNLIVQLGFFANMSHRTLYNENVTVKPQSNSKFYKFNITSQMGDCTVYTCFLLTIINSKLNPRENIEFTHHFARPKQLKLPKPEKIIILLELSNGNASKIRIFSEVYLNGLYFYLDGYKRLTLSDNYFDLIPGRSKVIEVIEIEQGVDLEKDLRYKTLNQFLDCDVI